LFVGVISDWKASHQGKSTPSFIEDGGSNKTISRFTGNVMLPCGCCEESTSDVYNLKQPADIAGTYGAVGGGIAIAGGVKGVLAKNGKGVVIDLVASQKGVSINIGGGGFTITME
jgi:hypothetical protein